ncbi:FAD-binding oxidoreductase [Herbiconiux sp. KACC 21604]|uniref:NAD(P)/FAD-dependent oxidoreductase n=1 Tax=unclassified Herbiconiux TaxID=2618217 RepID=UPI00149107C3|nr:FAD-binding oxidoreductase [Herbiconiux sp. SALV-R1]QJU55676.1 FAD-dependent oxidoreductase [Herbiconiux sp. SALV-R1]WPO86879.1 FAD-binding oxidoreductase [Herbiconiux sp. KACC 21604]
MLPGVHTGAIRSGYDVVIVGAGIQGLALAHELAKRGITDVLVIDRSWPGGGASGRNGELIRSAFSSPEWCGLFDLALDKWQTLSAELDYNILFNRDGYAVLASTEEQWAMLQRDRAFQRSIGLRSELLDDADARRLLPAAAPEMVRGALYQPHGGFAHHDSVVAGYLEQAAARGVHVVGGREVVAVERSGSRATAVVLADGTRIGCGVVVNAAGGHAPDVDRMLGVELGILSARLEMIVTQPMRPFLGPAVAALDLLGYCHQTMRGEFVGGTELAHVDQTTSLRGTWAMVRDMATKFTRLFPSLAGVRLLRHWAGTVSQTPDLAPALGPVPELENVVLSVGWVYGFMGAPAAGELLAAYIDTGRVDPRLAPFGIERVREGRWIAEGSLVVETAA